MDNFKSKYKKSFHESPELSGNDEKIWENVLSAYKVQKSSRQRRKLFMISGIAASVILAALVLFLTNNPIRPISNSKTNLLAEKHKEQKNIGETSDSIKNVNPGIDNSKEEIPSEIKRTEKKDISGNKVIEFLANQNIIKESLSDNSKITLNKHAQALLNESFNEENRHINLKGEAYFEVEKISNKPFTVFFRDHKLVVTGTKFNVRTIDGENVEITVSEGQVHVYPEKDSEKYYAVNAGEQLIINSNHSITITPVSASHYTVWSTGQLNFNRITLKELSTVLSRYYSSEVVVEQDVESCLFSGNLSGLKLEEALKIVSLTNKLEISDIKGQFYLHGPSCK